MKILIVGATGLVGSSVLKLALDEPKITTVVAPVRKAIPPHPKLLSPIVNFDSLPEDENWWNVDAVICTLGTTIKAAGSKEAFARVDLEYPLLSAAIAKKHNVSTFVFNSAIGANKSSRFFYNRIKGEAEDKLLNIGFKSLTVVRPGLIGGDRSEKRAGESIFKFVTKLFQPVLPERYHINPAEQIAKVILKAAIDAPNGLHIITSDHLI